MHEYIRLYTSSSSRSFVKGLLKSTKWFTRVHTSSHEFARAHTSLHELTRVCRTFHELFAPPAPPNSSLHGFTRLYTSSSSCLLGKRHPTSTDWLTRVRTSSHGFARVRTSLLQFTKVCTSSHWLIPPPVPIHSSLHGFTRLHTCSSSFLLVKRLSTSRDGLTGIHTSSHEFTRVYTSLHELT